MRFCGADIACFPCVFALCATTHHPVTAFSLPTPFQEHVANRTSDNNRLPSTIKGAYLAQTPCDRDSNSMIFFSAMKPIFNNSCPISTPLSSVERPLSNVRPSSIPRDTDAVENKRNAPSCCVPIAIDTVKTLLASLSFDFYFPHFH